MQPVAWRLSWQDFRQHVPGVGMTRPEPAKMDYATREEADAARAALPEDELVVSVVTPVFFEGKAAKEGRGFCGPGRRFACAAQAPDRLT